jgi:hypothetical protein
VTLFRRRSVCLSRRVAQMPRRRTKRLATSREYVMRLMGWLLLALVTCAWLASELPVERAAMTDDSLAWRRTAQGWERLQVRPSEPTSDRPTLHPAIVGLLEILVPLGAMLAFSGRNACGSSQ